MPLSPQEVAKRAFVSLLLVLARSYSLAVDVRRESPDADLLRAFKRVSRVVHPDKGGRLQDQQRLNAARDQWDEARRDSRPQRGRPAGSGAAGASAGPLLPTAAPRRAEFCIHSTAVLLTYQAVKDMEQWRRLIDFVGSRLKTWRVKYWTETLEANTDGGFHIHMKLQFLFQRDVRLPNTQGVVNLCHVWRNEWRQIWAHTHTHMKLHSRKVHSGVMKVRAV